MLGKRKVSVFGIEFKILEIIGFIGKLLNEFLVFVFLLKITLPFSSLDKVCLIFIKLFSIQSHSKARTSPILIPVKSISNMIGLYSDDSCDNSDISFFSSSTVNDSTFVVA